MKRVSRVLGEAAPVHRRRFGPVDVAVYTSGPRTRIGFAVSYEPRWVGFDESTRGGHWSILLGRTVIRVMKVR